MNVDNQLNQYYDTFPSLRQSDHGMMLRNFLINKKILISKIRQKNNKEIPQDNLKHIVKRHVKGGEKAIPGKKSIFNEGENFIRIALEAWQKGTSLKANAKIYDTGRIIGTNLKGNPTTMVEVCLNGTMNSIKTIYPI